jgi:2-keto-4-pentenoate hydratase
VTAPRARHPAARALIDARRSGRAAPPVAVADAPAAYAVQREVARALRWFGDAPPRFWKSGGASVDTQTHAPLPPDGVLAGPASLGGRRFRAPRVEAEVALRLGRDIDAAEAAGLDARRAATAVDAFCVSIEIVESRWHAGLDAPALAKLADLQSHGALVLGDWAPFAPRDWSAQPCRVRIGARAPLERVGTHPLGDPVRVLPAWLRHASADGAVLRAGTIVTTGSWVGMLEAWPGESVEVSFAGIGRVSATL